MATEEVRIQNVEDSQAFAILDELIEDGLLPVAEATTYKDHYKELHDTVVGKHGDMEMLSKRVKELSQQLLSEKIKLERLNINLLVCALVVAVAWSRPLAFSRVGARCRRAFL
jgi:hypothetical protein